MEEFHSQAGLQAAVKHLEEDSKAPATITVGRGEEGMFYPPHMRGRGGNMMTKLFKKSPETKSLTEELTSAYQDALKKCEDPHQLKILYLQLCWHKPYYGSVFFKGIVEKPPQYLKLLSTSEKRIVVAVNMDCVHLMTARSPSVSCLVCGLGCRWLSVSRRFYHNLASLPLHMLLVKRLAGEPAPSHAACEEARWRVTCCL